MLFNSPLDIDIESGENLFLVFNDDHLALSISFWLIELAVEIPRDLVRASLVWIPEHNSDQQQVLAVNLGDVRELGEVDPVSVSKSLTLGQEKTLVHY